MECLSVWVSGDPDSSWRPDKSDQLSGPRTAGGEDMFGMFSGPGSAVSHRSDGSDGWGVNQADGSSVSTGENERKPLQVGEYEDPEFW